MVHTMMHTTITTGAFPSGAKTLRGAQVGMLSYVEASHAADGEAAVAIGAAAEQGAQAIGG